MNILIIAPRFGTIHRGLETYVKELISNIDKNKFKITIVSAEHDEIFEGVNFEKFHILGREVFDFIFKYKIFRKILSYFNIYGSSDFEALLLMYKSKGFITKNQYDIVLPFGGYWSFFILNKLVDRKKTRIVSVGQASVVKKEVMQSDYFVALTPFAYEEASKLINKTKVVLIPNAVDTEKFKPNHNTVKNTILCVAAFTADKNHISLLNALSKMPTDIKLVLIGKGPLSNSLKNHSVCKTHSVTFKSVSLEDMPTIYKNASIFTLASPEEAFGIVFLEALSSGLNVVAHDAPRQKYVVGDSGFYCNVFDSDEYAKTLQKVLDIQQKEQNILQVQRFSWDSIVLKYDRFFTEVFNEKQNHS